VTSPGEYVAGRTLTVSAEHRTKFTRVMRHRVLRSPFVLYVAVMVLVAFGWLLWRGVGWLSLVVLLLVPVLLRSVTRAARQRVDQLFPEGATLAASLSGESLSVVDAAGSTSVIPLTGIASVEAGASLVFLRLKDHPAALAVPAALLDEADLAAIAEAATRS